jgi:CRP/FNR family transcriptional regulator, cyclic AMP receptor protein
MPAVVSVALLNKIPLLEGLDLQQLEVLAAAMRVANFSKRDFVIHKGSQGDELFFLLRGRLLVVDVAPDGKETGLNFLMPGDFFGEIAVIDGLARSASVVAVSASQVAVLPKVIARDLIYHTPLVAERMFNHIAGKLRASTDFRAILGISNAFQRVFALIRLLAKPDPGQLVTIENMPTHQHIALMVNTSRETVTRALHILHESAIIEKDNQRMIVRQPQKLNSMAMENENGIGGKLAAG